MGVWGMMKTYLVGEEAICMQSIKYYVIADKLKYGIRLESKKGTVVISDEVYFTEEEAEAYSIAEKMKRGQVTLIGMIDVLDDLIA